MRGPGKVSCSTGRACTSQMCSDANQGWLQAIPAQPSLPPCRGASAKTSPYVSLAIKSSRICSAAFSGGWRREQAISIMNAISMEIDSPISRRHWTRQTTSRDISKSVMKESNCIFTRDFKAKVEGPFKNQLVKLLSANYQHQMGLSPACQTDPSLLTTRPN